MIKRRRRVIIATLLILAAAACWLYLALRSSVSDSFSFEGKPGVGSASTVRNLERGHQLALSYCQGCHLFPEPALLDKATWEKGVLPIMAAWLGLAKVVPARRTDGTIITEAEVYPTSPLISQEDWRSIQDYYKTAAPEKPLPQTNRPPIKPALTRFKIKPLAYRRSVPMTTLVKIQSQKLYVGDAMSHTLEALNPAGERQFAVEFDSAPISLRIRNDLLDLTLVGRLFPSDDTKGKLLTLRPLPDDMKIDKVLGSLRRPVDTAFADLNGDGREDLIVCQFGNRVGRLSWFENRGAGQFEEHILADRPGAIRALVHDVNKDGWPDLFVLMGQAREGIYLFINRGPVEKAEGQRLKAKGPQPSAFRLQPFEERVLIEQHPLYGYTSLELVDFNQDGHIDLLAANGDNGEYDSPPKNYHGVHLYLNDGQNRFSEKWFYPLHGAYKAIARDFDRDGDLDIAAISFFPDYQNSPEESFVYLENKTRKPEGQRLEGVQPDTQNSAFNFVFEASSFPECTSGRWITMDAGDLDGDGDDDIVLGSLILGPTTIPIPDHVQAGWKTNGPPILMLENVSN